jgi:hypothetical protein
MTSRRSGSFAMEAAMDLVMPGAVAGLLVLVLAIVEVIAALAIGHQSDHRPA